MKNGDIIYDRVFEIVNVYSTNEANEYLKEYEVVDENTCLIWEFLSFGCAYVNHDERVDYSYVLGHKYKRIDKSK